MQEKETIIKKAWDAIDNLTDKSLQSLQEALANKDKKIRELEEVYKTSPGTKNSSLEAKLNQPLTNKELLFNLVKKLESSELNIEVGEDWAQSKHNLPGGIYLIDSKTQEKIYLFTVWTKHDDYHSEVNEKEWKEINNKFKESFLKEQKELELVQSYQSFAKNKKLAKELEVWHDEIDKNE